MKKNKKSNKIGATLDLLEDIIYLILHIQYIYILYIHITYPAWGYYGGGDQGTQ